MPNLRISQRMRLEQTQLEGVEKRIQNTNDHCLLLGLPCGLDASDVQKQTHTLKNSIITYLLQKQAAGIINLPTTQVSDQMDTVITLLSLSLSLSLSRVLSRSSIFFHLVHFHNLIFLMLLLIFLVVHQRIVI